MIHVVPETGSTNADQAEKLQKGERPAEGNWIVADRQTAGRGRQARNWFDGAGNFMGSTVVYPAPSDPPASTLALLTGLALYETTITLIPDPAALSLKWPNDLLIGRAKAAGILLESQSGGVIIGVGVNLAVAPHIEGRETIALSQVGPTPDRDDFAGQLAACFATELDRWRTYGLGPMLRRWAGVAHPKGTALTVHDGDGSVVEGTFDGLADDGSLSLRLADGTTRAIHAGDVMLS